MGDKAATLAKARRELEDLYLGIPDDSVNLTFEDLAKVTEKPLKPSFSSGKVIKTLDPIQDSTTPTPRSPLNKLPSLDFSRGLQQTTTHQHHHHHQRHVHEAAPYSPSRRGSTTIPETRAEFRQAVGNSSSLAFDSVSVMSKVSTYNQEEKAQRRRPGIPHSNICTICTTYIYIFRHRCLVCGRVYCRDCVSVGMGDMAEGRKCVECFGRRFSQRYIKRAGRVGCCSRYPSKVKQAELQWAEKGPRRSGERGYGNVMSGKPHPRSPMTSSRSHYAINAASGNNTPSFVASSTFSPYTPNHHHLPL